MNPPAKPLLIYDGDCAFCLTWIARWKRVTGDAVDYAPSQQAAEQFPEIPPARFAAAVQLLEPDGTWTQGAEAVFRTLAASRRGGWLWAYRRVPGFAAASEWIYRVIARRRAGPHCATPER